jgi:hypothetical protein
MFLLLFAVAGFLGTAAVWKAMEVITRPWRIGDPD